MSDPTHIPKDTLTTLDDLRRAIESRRADAWRTAFEWREGIIQRHTGLFHADALKAWIAERDEGMALIREKLQS